MAASRQRKRPTELRYVCEFQALSLVKDFAIVSLARDVYTEDDGLVDHLVEMNGRAYVLRDLRLGIHE